MAKKKSGQSDKGGKQTIALLSAENAQEIINCCLAIVSPAG